MKLKTENGSYVITGTPKEIAEYILVFNELAEKQMEQKAAVNKAKFISLFNQKREES